jgi:hypothetical protein
VIHALPAEVVRLAGQAWAFRYRVEREASLRFLRIADRLQRMGAPDEVIAMAVQASADESHHAALCQHLAEVFGCGVDERAPLEVPEIAPVELDARGRTLYEVVAACCITETESAGVLTTLLDHAPLPEVKQVLRALARDEVQHARLGWATLAFAREHGDVTFLAPLIPVMLSGTVPEALFASAVDPATESTALLCAGVLPHTLKRETFLDMLRDVVLPGLRELGVDPLPAEAWLAARSV